MWPENGLWDLVQWSQLVILEKAVVIEGWEGKLTWSEFRREWGRENEDIK